MRVPGPAIIAEDETSTFITASFDARIDGAGCIVMERRVVIAAYSVGSPPPLRGGLGGGSLRSVATWTPPPTLPRKGEGSPAACGTREVLMTDATRLIDLQIMWNRLIAVVEEQAQVLMRTAFSPIVRECGDLSAGVFDRQGRMLAQAVTGTPGHVNSMAESVKHFIRHFPLDTMKPGDAYITNDPWMGTGHLNDFVITTPAFNSKGQLVALFSCTSHLMDIGGIGFGPDATDVFMEGLYIPMLKLIDQGTVNETLMAMIRANTRLPIDTEGDTYSLAACNDVGAKRLAEMMDEFGIDTLDPLAEHICARSREAVMAEIAKLPRGTWRNEMTVDGYDAPVTLAAALTVSRQRHPCRFHRHLAAVALRHQRAARLHHRLHGVRARLRGGERDPEQCGLARAAHGVGAGRLHPECAEARAGVQPPHHRADAARRGVRLPAPDHSGSRAGRGHIVPVESQRARRDAGRAPAAITGSRWR